MTPRKNNLQARRQGEASNSGQVIHPTHHSSFITSTAIVLALLVLPTLVGSGTSGIAQANSVGQLSATLSTSIRRQCMPLAFSRDVGTYRSCVLSTIAGQQTAVPETNGQPSALSFDEKFAVEKKCGQESTVGTETYTNCMQVQLSELLAIPSTKLTQLSDEEKHVVRQSCYTAQETLGAAAYRQCINKAAIDLQLYPAVSLAELSRSDRNTVQLACSPDNSSESISDYRRCLNREVARLRSDAAVVTPTTIGSDDGIVRVTTQADIINGVEASDSQLTVISSLDTGSSTNSTPSREPRVISRPQNANGSPEQDQSVDFEQSPTIITANQDAESGLAANARASSSDTTGTNPIDTVVNSALPDWIPPNVVDLLGKAGIDTLPKLGFLAIPLAILLILLPVLLKGKQDDSDEYVDSRYEGDDNDLDDLGLDDVVAAKPSETRPASAAGASTIKRERTSEDIPEGSNKAHKNPAIDESLNDRTHRNETSAVSEEKVSSKSGHSKDEEPDLAATIQTSDPVKATSDPAFDKNVETDLAPESGITANEIDLALPGKLNGVQAGSDFKRWLEDQSSDNQRRYVIEFLLYWISFGEENYNSTLRERIQEQISEAGAEDPHSFIKSTVLDARAEDLNTSLEVMKNRFNNTQQQQILNLILAVLVRVDGITPVQNTFFRFFADYIGVGSEKLEQHYQSAFETEMPPMPRPDKTIWWDKSSKSGDLVKSTRDSTSPLARLGLPEEASDEELEQIWKLAKRRHNPTLFSDLGKKEQKLVHRHLRKLGEALDSMREMES